MLKMTFAAIRGIIMATWTLLCIIIILIRSSLLGYDLDWSLKVRKICMTYCLKILGVEIELRGTPPVGNYIYCSNHRSYLDPITVLRDVLVLPVAKAEVSSWPLIGYGAKVTGIMFVKRESRSSRQTTILAMKEVLENDQAVVIYPEGTTHVAPTTADFKLGAFRLAADLGKGVVPIAIEYKNPNNAWVGSISFLSHFLQTFGDWRTHLTIEYGEPIYSTDKQVLMEETKSWIDQKMLEMRRNYNSLSVEIA